LGSAPDKNNKPDQKVKNVLQRQYKLLGKTQTHKTYHIPCVKIHKTPIKFQCDLTTLSPKLCSQTWWCNLIVGTILMRPALLALVATGLLYWELPGMANAGSCSSGSTKTLRN